MNTPYNEEQKNRIYAWRENNKEKYKKVQRKAVEKYRKKIKEEEGKDHQLNYYYKNRDEINAKRRARYKEKKMEGGRAK